MNKSDLYDALPTYVDHCKNEEKADSTVGKYKTDIKRFIDFLPPDVEVTKEHVLAYKKQLTSGEFKTSSVNNFIAILNTFLKFTGNSPTRVKKIKTQKQSSFNNVVSMSDYKRLLRFAKIRGRDDIYMIMKVIITTGVRGKELDDFTVENIESFYFKVNNKGKEREIILTQELARELRRYAREHHIKSGRLFPISYSTIWRQMKKTAGAAKVSLEKVHPHSFRHLFAKEYMKKYNNVLDLADILGHNDLASTRIYTRSNREEQRKKLEKM